MLFFLCALINNPNKTNENLVEEFFNKHEVQPELPKFFEFYKIKYDSFTFWEDNQTSGFFYWENRENQPYNCYMLFRKQFNGRHWKPFLLELTGTNKNCSMENYGNQIQFTKGELILMVDNQNEGYKFSHTDEYSKKLINSFIASGELNQDAVLKISQ